MSRKAYVGFGAKRMSDLAQSVCRIWHKMFLAQNVFGAKRFWALPRTGCRTTEVVIGAIYHRYSTNIYGYIRQAGRQTNDGDVCMG